MDKAELMQKEIEDKRKLPEEIKKEIAKSIFHNLLIATIIIIYLCTINVLFYKLENSVFEHYMKFIALGIICVTVIIFEIAYRRKSKRTAIIGTELLLCSIISLYIPYIYLFTKVNLKLLTTILPLSISGYYIVKAILIYGSRKIEYENNLSDVKEILKDTERKSYLEEESTKSYREYKIQEEKNKKELLEKECRKAASKAKQSKGKNKKTTKKASKTTRTTTTKTSSKKNTKKT